MLAADVQVGEPSGHEHGEDEVRFALTSEAGLNDAVAFPFVYLAIAIATVGVTPGGWPEHQPGRAVTNRSSRSPSARTNRKNDRSAVAAPSTLRGRHRRVSPATQPNHIRGSDEPRATCPP